jgi:hypothetical protein
MQVAKVGHVKMRAGTQEKADLCLTLLGEFVDRLVLDDSADPV